MSQWEKVYGVYVVEVLLCYYLKWVKQLWLVEGWYDLWVQVFIELVVGFCILVGQCDWCEFDEWVEGVYQGVVVEVSFSQVWGENMFEELFEWSEGVLLLLVLDGVIDLYNFGVCLCIVDVVGVQVVIVFKDKFVIFNVIVCKVVCGVVEVILLVVVINFVCILEKFQQCGLWVVGIVGEVDKIFYQFDFKGLIVLVMGVEGKGMCWLICEYCDFFVRLLMVGSVSSLNVLVVIGVCLFEIFCQCILLE